mgnify:CR=1 FL=1
MVVVSERARQEGAAKWCEIECSALTFFSSRNFNLLREDSVFTWVHELHCILSTAAKRSSWNFLRSELSDAKSL